MKKYLLDKNNDIRPLLIVLLGVFFVAVKLFLCSAQSMYLEPEGAVLDDMLMYNSAVSIGNGEWLGPYSWLTLSKHSFFALWLAILHVLKIPYLLGGQLLWAGACLAAAWALGPALKKRWLMLGLFGVLLFNPASVANPAPYGFVLRVYRDNIFPALCLFCIAGVIGYALRCTRPVKHMVGWLIMAGGALAACWLTREDGWWLLPFIVAASVVTIVFILRSKQKNKWQRCTLLLTPFVLLAMGNLAWRTVNYQYYGRFIISDFSTGEFADAYGAMTRIDHENWDPKVAVPLDVREKLYQHVPAIAQLAPLLESSVYWSQFADEDYSSGSFYWALRMAAAELGYYDTPQKAQAFWEGIAKDINSLCDSGVLPAGPKRNSVNPPIKAAYVLPVVQQSAEDLVFCATFSDCDPRSMFSPHSNDPGMYASLIAPMEEFLHDKAQTITVENSEEAYFTPRQNFKFKCLDAVRLVYSILTPFALPAALVWQCIGGAQMVKRMRQKQPNPTANLLWVVQLGILFCFLLRIAMVAFVSVSSFTIGTYIMYLASAYPLMLVYGFLGTAQLVAYFWQKIKKPGKTPAKGAA